MLNANKTEIAFIKSKSGDPVLTDFVHFGRAVVCTGLKRSTIQKRMSQLVNKNQYPEFTLKEMLNHFEWMSKLKNDQKSGKIMAQHSGQFWTKGEGWPRFRPKNGSET